MICWLGVSRVLQADGFNSLTRYWNLNMIEGSLLYNLHSGDDINKFYGPNLTAGAGSSSFGYGLGYWFGVSREFLIGGGFENFEKDYDVNTADALGDIETDQWRLHAANYFLGIRYELGKVFGTHSYFTAHGGYLALNGSTLTLAFNNPVIPSQTYSFGGVSTGTVTLGLGAQKIMGKMLGVTGEAGYRIASATPVKAVLDGKEYTLTNQDGTDGSLDLGGIYIKVSVDLFFGGFGDEELQQIRQQEKKPEPPSYDPPEGLNSFDEGLDYFRHNLYEQAASDFEDATTQDPLNNRAWLYLGQSYYYLHNIPGAVAAYEHYLRFHAEDTELQKWVDEQKKQMRKTSGQEE